MATKDIYLEMLKEWGGFQVGDIVRFGRTKGERMIENGIGRKVKKQKAVNDSPSKPQRSPKVETAEAKPQAEKAVVTPEPVSKAAVQDNAIGQLTSGKDKNEAQKK